jgi:integrase/recombinase XerD
MREDIILTTGTTADNTKEELRAVGLATFGATFLSSRQLPPLVTEGLIEEFKDWIEGNVGAETLGQYVKIVRGYCLGRSLAEVNHKSFFIVLSKEIKAAGKGLSLVMRNTAAVKKFLMFLCEAYDFPIFNLALVRCKKPPLKNPSYLELEEIAAIQSLPLRHRLDLRDRTLFEFFIDTGARNSEAIGVDWRDINFEKGEIDIVGKGGKPRTLRLNTSLPWIRKYLKERKSDAAPLFITYRDEHRIARADARSAIHKLGKRAGITKPVYPHMLRHTFGTYLMRMTDPKTTQTLLGHADVETSLRYYVGVSEKQMRTAHEALGRLIGGARPGE